MVSPFVVDFGEGRVGGTLDGPVPREQLQLWFRFISTPFLAP
jgi:hypothetical protein